MRSILFVILTWNSERWIAQCLDSVLSLRSFTADIKVVDNGSSDKTLEILKAYENKTCIDVIKLEKNVGTTVSRNIALNRIGENNNYVCILDSDTEINDLAITKMIAVLDADSKIGIVGPIMKNSSGIVQDSGRNLPTLGIKIGKVFPIKRIQEAAAKCEIPNTPIVDGLQDVPYLLSACWLMPKKTLEVVGLLDEAIFYAPEDVDYCVRCWNKKLRVVLCWNAMILHDYQRLSHKKLFSKTNYEHLKGLAYYFRKYNYLFNADRVISLKSRME